MSEFRVHIDLDNDAFTDPEGAKAEVARILRQLADRVVDEGLAGRHTLMDINGNTVGFAKKYHEE